MQKKVIPNILSIAGVDPSGGAGIFADLKAMSALGGYACGVVAALTAQNTQGVTGVQGVSSAFVKQQLDTLFADVRIDAVKIGMLSDVSVIETVAQALKTYRPPFVVLDPVMVAKSGDRLLPEDCVEALKSELLPLATVITPNLPEAAVLSGLPEADSAEALVPMAQKLSTLVAPGGWVLLKGGHLNDSEAPDLLTNGTEQHIFTAPRILTKNTHGTGCTLSSAIATLLPQTESVPQAVRQAKDYISQAIAHADELEVGHGHGPVHHFYRLWKEK